MIFTVGTLSVNAYRTCLRNIEPQGVQLLSVRLLIIIPEAF